MIVDASAIGAIIFREAEFADAAAFVADAPMIAPTLLPFEIASIAAKKKSRGLLDEEGIGLALTVFDAMAIQLIPVRARDALAVASQTRLSVYDASYLWLARRFDTPLATCDRRLADAAGITPIGKAE
ncbi:type II toxin-antitoxin system VapC family toxin [Sphingoaurantiacus capsulatus]|uniref:Ribonuclease VapC n=1 Tax=Sphingoaurantiacus capsulatus TaxID=1771310 RepID=A0ABV7XER5_9SPHN